MTLVMPGNVYQRNMSVDRCRDRTGDVQIRGLALYPTELNGRLRSSVFTDLS